MQIPKKVTTLTGHTAIVTVLKKGIFHFNGQTNHGVPVDFRFIHKDLITGDEPMRHQYISQSFSNAELEILHQFFKDLESGTNP